MGKKSGSRRRRRKSAGLALFLAVVLLLTGSGLTLWAVLAPSWGTVPEPELAAPAPEPLEPAPDEPLAPPVPPNETPAAELGGEASPPLRDFAELAATYRQMPPDTAARLLLTLPEADAISLLKQLDPTGRAQLLAELSVAEASRFQRLLLEVVS